MPAIVTLTFNPALDKSSSVSQLISEKKLKCTPPIYEPGGGGINVARAIHKLGGDVLALYLAGGPAGDQLGNMLQNEGIGIDAIQISENTRENLIIADLASRKQYLFDMPGPHINPGEWQQCLKHLELLNDLKYIVASGSLPPGLPDNIFLSLSALAEKKRAKLVIDTSGRALQLAVQCSAWMIKPNLRELGLLAGKEDLGVEMAGPIARQLIAQKFCQVILVSLGAEGALLVDSETITRLMQPKEKVKSTVGAGDSLVAGMIYKLSLGETLVEAARYGVACGCAATLKPGSELCAKADADRIFPSITAFGIS